MEPRHSRSAEVDLDPYQTGTMQEIIDAWLLLTFAVHSLNRAMSNQDLALSPTVIGSSASCTAEVSRDERATPVGREK